MPGRGGSWRQWMIIDPSGYSSALSPTSSDSFPPHKGCPPTAAALANELRARGATTLIATEIDAYVDDQLTVPVPAASATMDNGILLRQIELRSSLHRLVSVLSPARWRPIRPSAGSSSLTRGSSSITPLPAPRPACSRAAPCPLKRRPWMRRAEDVLVVDDEPVLRVLIREILQDEGYAVIDAADGQSMLDLLQGVHPDLVLMDVMMPGVDGRKAYQALRSRTDMPDLPVVMMSAAVQPGKLDPSIAAFLRKPFDLTELVELVAQLIGPPHADGKVPPAG